MGWGSGSRLAGELIEAAKDTISNPDDRQEFYELMINSFKDFDCDTLDECTGIDPAFDEVWENLYPSDDDYEDEDE
jgi:hypothetical protein